MKRLIIAACIGSWTLAGVALAQPLAGTTGPTVAPPTAKSAAPPAWSNAEAVPPVPVAPQSLAPQTTPPTGSPGETPATVETRAHELHLLQAESAQESVHRAAIARADQRTRRLESQRWFGISNKRPSASVDPFDGDYSAYWASNYPFYPLRWVGSGEPWGFVEVQP
jgi:hypothetical protein